MPPVLPYAVAAIAALAFISSAEPTPSATGAPEGAVVRTHVRWGLFATTEPAITAVRFPASASADGWTESEPARVSSEGDLSHAITVAEITPCVVRALPTDDNAARTLVQWSSDDGAHWQELTDVPVVASAVENSGSHPGALTLRYRARSAAESCTMRVVYTAVPAR
ncbi:MAG TPA: hypothetical protein VN717_02380 [Gemmatimonadaceae bacterium]|nr:hypothetical protein [Gemmatimonadaceae bacterium]